MQKQMLLINISFFNNQHACTQHTLHFNGCFLCQPELTGCHVFHSECLHPVESGRTFFHFLYVLLPILPCKSQISAPIVTKCVNESISFCSTCSNHLQQHLFMQGTGMNRRSSEQITARHVYK